MKLFIVLLLVLLCGLPGCSENKIFITQKGYTERETIKSELNVDAKAYLDISNGAGRIEVFGHDKDVVLIEAIKHARDATELKYMEPEIQSTNNSVVIRTNYLKSFVHGVIDYKMFVPHTMKIRRARTGSGSIIISQMFEDMNVESGAGRIELKAVKKNVTAQTGSGSIYVVNHEDAQGAIKVETGSGRIEVSQAAGSVAATTGSGAISVTFNPKSKGSVDAQTGSGRIYLTQCSDSVTAQAESGTIIVDQKKVSEDNEINIRTSSGRIELRLPGDTNAKIEVIAPLGRLISDFDIFGSDEDSNRGEISGTIGEGGAAISLKSATGDIEIIKK